MSARQVDAIVDDAEAVVNAFVFTHHAAAIPALIGACVMWAVNHGGADVVKGSLRNAIRLADQVEGVRRGEAN